MHRNLVEIGEVIGKLRVVSIPSQKKAACICECGATVERTQHQLRYGKTRASCGCSSRLKLHLYGKRFGSFEVVRPVPGSGNIWLCRCECGTEREFKSDVLRALTSCGCHYRKRETFLEGKRFGKITVLFRVKADTWQCKCDCGAEMQIRARKLLKDGRSTCWDCYSETRTHETKDPLYCIWEGMRRRCYANTDPAYRLYGGRGIQVQWEKFTDFKEWAYANGFKPGLTIHRINGDGNYRPENCTFITGSENSRHQRAVRYILLKDGRRLTAPQIADMFGFRSSEIYGLTKTGLPLNLAVLLAIKQHLGHIPLEFDGCVAEVPEYYYVRYGRRHANAA